MHPPDRQPTSRREELARWVPLCIGCLVLTGWLALHLRCRSEAMIHVLAPDIDLEVVVDGTPAGTVPADTHAAFPLRPGRRVVVLSSSERALATRWEIEPRGAALVLPATPDQCFVLLDDRGQVEATSGSSRPFPVPLELDPAEARRRIQPWRCPR